MARAARPATGPDLFAPAVPAAPPVIGYRAPAAAPLPWSAPPPPRPQPLVQPPEVKNDGKYNPRNGMRPGLLPPSWSAGQFEPDPNERCVTCGSGRFWRVSAGWCCATCHPDASSRQTSP